MILGHYKPGQDSKYHHQISESIPGKTTRALADLALEHEIYICFGVSELDDDKIYNSQVLLNPQGEVQIIRRKNNLKPEEVSGENASIFSRSQEFKTGCFLPVDRANTGEILLLI